MNSEKCGKIVQVHLCLLLVLKILIFFKEGNTPWSRVRLLIWQIGHTSDSSLVISFEPLVMICGGYEEQHLVKFDGYWTPFVLTYWGLNKMAAIYAPHFQRHYDIRTLCIFIQNWLKDVSGGNGVLDGILACRRTSYGYKSAILGTRAF